MEQYIIKRSKIFIIIRMAFFVLTIEIPKSLAGFFTALKKMLKDHIVHLAAWSKGSYLTGLCNVRVFR